MKPSLGFGVREDSGVENGSEISSYYDPLISKVITWGQNRTEALNRMKGVLDEYELFGVETNIAFCQWLVSHPKFQSGEFDTHFIAKHFIKERDLTIPDNIIELAILASMSHLNNGLNVRNDVHSVPVQQTTWKEKRKEHLR